MKKLLLIFLLLFTAVSAPLLAEEQDISLTIDLQYVSPDDVMSLLQTLVDESVLLQNNNNELILEGKKNKVNIIREIVRQIDTPPSIFDVEFTVSSHRLNIDKIDNTLATSRHIASRNMTVTERQWIKINTGLSVPVARRVRYADGTERQSFRFVKVKKSYILKMHEFSGWSVIQIGINQRNEDIQQAIADTRLDTTVVGKTGEWIEIAASKPDSSDNKGNYPIYLYLKIKLKKLPKKPDLNKEKPENTP